MPKESAHDNGCNCRPRRFFYVTEQYDRALFLIILSIISGAAAAIVAVVNPDWYFKKRIMAGMDVDFFNPRKGVVSLLVTKVIVIAVLVWVAWHIARKAGYL
jgi:hypothetical protein